MLHFNRTVVALLSALVVTGCSGHGGYARLPQAYPKASATAMNPWAQSREAGLSLFDLGRKEEEVNRKMRAVVLQGEQRFANIYVPDGTNLADGQLSVAPIFGAPFFPLPRQIMDRVYAGTGFAIIAPDPGNRLTCNSASDARGRPQYFLQVTIDGLDQGTAFARKGISPFADDGDFSGDFNGGSTMEETSFFVSAEMRRCGTREGVHAAQTMVAVRRTTDDRGFFLAAKVLGITYRDMISDGIGLNRARNLALSGFLAQFATDAMNKLGYADRNLGFDPSSSSTIQLCGTKGCPEGVRPTDGSNLTTAPRKAPTDASAPVSSYSIADAKASAALAAALGEAGVFARQPRPAPASPTPSAQQPRQPVQKASPPPVPPSSCYGNACEPPSCWGNACPKPIGNGLTRGGSVADTTLREEPESRSYASDRANCSQTFASSGLTYGDCRSVTTSTCTTSAPVTMPGIGFRVGNTILQGMPVTISGGVTTCSTTTSF